MLNIGHRGASGILPENTLPAFEVALAQGADGVELDVHRCKSGELVVIHDDSVDRTTNGTGRIAQMTLAEIRALRIAGRETIPTLEEALACMGEAYCFVEIKHPDAALATAELIEAHRQQTGRPERLWLISFAHEALGQALQRYPSLAIGASFELLTPGSIALAHKLGARAILPHFRSFSLAQVQEAHALGLQVFTWTVNDVLEMGRLKSMGVDGIMSDYPDRLARA